MYEELRLEQLISRIKQSFREFRDVRQGKNIQYDMVDAGMGAFSVFFIQSSSFLSAQQDMKRRKGQCNPRKINRLCSTALLIGMADHKKILEESSIRKAIAELDQP